jgi:hypothetical protein
MMRLICWGGNGLRYGVRPELVPLELAVCLVAALFLTSSILPRVSSGGLRIFTSSHHHIKTLKAPPNFRTNLNFKLFLSSSSVTMAAEQRKLLGKKCLLPPMALTTDH